MTKLIVGRALRKEAVAEALSKEINSLTWISESVVDNGFLLSEIWVSVTGRYSGHLLTLVVKDIGTGEDHFELVRIKSTTADLSVDRAFYTEEDVRKVFHECILPKIIRVYYKDLAAMLCQLFEIGVKEKVTRNLIWSVTHLRCKEDEVGLVLTIDKDSIEIWYKEAEEGDLPKMEIHLANEVRVYPADVLPDQIEWIRKLLSSTIAKYCD